MCYDHMGRSTGGSSTLLLCVFFGQWFAQMGLAGYFWFTSAGGDVLDGLEVTKGEPPSAERGITIILMLGCITAHYLWVFVYRGLGAKITLGLDTSIMILVLIGCIQGGACLLAWRLPLPPSIFAVACVLFIVGIGLEALSDEQLHAFVARKAQPGYSGPKIMSTGLRSVSRHPNMIGFNLYWIGFALMSGAWYYVLGVGLVFAVFTLIQILPALEHHMHGKYGAEWERYVAVTPQSSKGKGEHRTLRQR
jgi:protein-S-isoprenylcysteine O-methyltransferase Ste14